ncbi:MAG: hypothetical protein EOP54_22225 [Sphingobacteriales bacterium]|nr:MAG: hypothetical protein EOP54_22225 [Sphingobacteriales bacterium]
MKHIITLLLVLATANAFSQNTLQFKEGDTSPAATINDIAWLAGTWQGNALGGWCEEIWSKPAGGSMMFSFRMMKDGQTAFYELGHVIEKDGTLLLQLKHFDGALKGWEKPEETEDFKLIKIEKNKIYLDGFTIEQKSADNIIMYVLMEDTGKELVFDYKRAK